MAKKDPNFPMQGKGGGMGGKYARKAENLSAKELKAAGAAKAAKKRTVSISDTKRVTSGANKGKTVGPGGKPLTGSVRLENGAMAVYKDGKRVTKAPAKKAASAPSTRSRSGSSSSSSSSSSSARKANPNANVKVGTIRKGAAGNKYNKWDGKKWVPVAAARTGSGSGQSSSVASKRPSRSAVSGTVAAAVAQGEAGGKGSGNGVKAGDNQGYVRGNPYAQQSAVTARRTGRPAMPGAVQAQTKNKREQDKRNQGRDALAIAGLTVGAAAAGARLAGMGAAAARGAGARKAIEGGARKAIGAAPPRAIPGGRPAAARVTIERMGQGTRGTGARPQSATPTPRKAITARPRPETIAERVQRGEVTRTSPIGNPKLDGTKNTGPKTLAQVRSDRARKAAATRKANAAKKK